MAPAASSACSPHAFFGIVAAALVAQMVGNYHANELMIGHFFHTVWLIARIAFPVAVLLLLRVPLSRIGLGLPRRDRGTRNIALVAVTTLVVVAIGLFTAKSYYHFYSGAFYSPGAGPWGRFLNFMIFTGSTLTGWEFMHRGVLLMGLSYVLTAREGVNEKTAARIAMAITCVFEVVFHFKKPEMEALGLLIGSPILSWIALRTQSIWLSFGIHLAVEILFITALIVH